QLLKALILFVMNHRPPEQRNLAGVTQVLQENDVEAEEKGADSPLDTLFLDLTMSDPARRAYELGFKKAKGEMKASIIESLLATISKFVDKEVADFTSFSDFDLKEIGNAKVVLYVIIPVMDNTYESFINLFFSQLFDELYKLAADHHAKLPHQVDFILDEFVNLGKFPKYEEFLATCRGYGIGVTTICQTLTQLQALYGKDKAESILGNHAVKICLNAANDVTAKYFSDLLGKSTVKVETGSESTSHSKEESHSKSDSYSYTSRSLMTPDEIMRMPEDQSLLIFSNARPVKATKAFQFKLFPGADHLVNLSQNEYQGQPEASQETNFHQRVEKWKAKLKETAQK
ncbi:VirD4-like conjugal transfer protein, CD1115 family, partial [Lactiplantibacillus plantarum]